MRRNRTRFSLEDGAPGAEGAKTATILIVDDEIVNIRLLERVLTTAGYTRLAATTEPRQGLDLCRRIRPDLILLDLLMPDLDGIAVLESSTTSRMSPR